MLEWLLLSSLELKKENERESYLSDGVFCLGSKLRVSTFLPFFRDISHMGLNPLLRAK